ncbi:ATP-binding protein [Streptomyces sp. NBC_00158]|uniref:ATP-binding protein n=1 Tax=Streptomyces sp. NBC_00158 TaxID=2903627 RepID=UPI003243DEA0
MAQVAAKQEDRGTMTDAYESLRSLLAVWPGRFRFPELLVALSEGRTKPLEDLAVAGLTGIAGDHDEYRACARLISDGEFRIAEEMLAECQALEGAQTDDLRTRLGRRRAECLELVLGRVQHLMDRAVAADVDAVPEREALTALCARSWPQADERLRADEEALQGVLDEKRRVLRGRCEEAAAQGMEPDTLGVCEELLKAGQLRLVALLLANGASPRPGPEAVPPLRGWAYAGETPSEVLKWHLDATVRPVSFDRWRPTGPAGKELLEAYAALADSNEATAARFSRALTEFLGGGDRPQPPVHRVEGGYLTAITGVFTDEETARFWPTGSVELFVAAPETEHRPETDLGRPYIAVGWSLWAQTLPERTPCAVLDLGHLVELVTLRAHVPVQLLRVLGRQWPLDVFTGGSAASLEALLGTDPGQWWHVLRWMVDLAGLGDLTTADALTFQTGPDAALLHLFLEFLARPKAGSQERDGYAVVRDCARNQPFAQAVERTVLAPIADSAASQVAFWAALSAAVPGQQVTFEEILLSAASVAGDGMFDDAHETEVRHGLARLATLPLAERADADEVRLHRCGVLLVLGGDADRKLEQAVARMAEEARETGADPSRAFRLADWQLYRYALHPGLRHYEQIADGPGTTAEELEAAAEALTGTTDELSASLSAEGESDVSVTLLEMRNPFAIHYPEVKLQVHSPDNCRVSISDAGLQRILYELLSNAAEACAVNGDATVRATVAPLSAEFAIDIQDNGPGLAYSEETEHFVFRKGESTRGPNRGTGLYIARRLARDVDGDLNVRSRVLGHPVLQGAHFRLLLPRA